MHEYKVLKSIHGGDIDALINNAAADGFQVRDFHVVLVPEGSEGGAATLKYVALMIKTHPD